MNPSPCQGTASGSRSEGIVVVDKPTGWTSHDVVARIRRLAGTRRVGHAGTLDPMATGVLLVGLGRATRLLGYLAGHDKDYLARIRLGVATTTDDADGEVVATHDLGAITDAAIDTAMRRLTGDIHQVPSAVSAIKVDGKRAYARVRAGETVSLAARPVRVARFDLVERHDPDLDVFVSCSTGTYVRALARDLGAALGVGGHLSALRRTRVGGFGLDRAITLDALGQSMTPVSLSDAVAEAFSRVDVSADDARRIGHGQLLPLVLPGDEPVGVFDPQGRVIALVHDREGMAKPLCVFV